MNQIEKDIYDFKRIFPFSSELKDSTFLITGATGLLGSMMVRCLLALGQNITVIAPVRNQEKARTLLGDDVHLKIMNMHDHDLPNVDYVIHLASPTGTKEFINHPVETSEFILDSSVDLLHYCRDNQVKAFLFASSLEVYGPGQGNLLLGENNRSVLLSSDVRNSYPIAKLMVENLCVSYAKELGLRTLVVRLTQTTGAGISEMDNRVMAQFIRKAVTGEDIVMKTPGWSSRSYLYTVDAVTGMLWILLKGEAGQIYNMANEESYVSANRLAEIIRDHVNPGISIRYELDDTLGYPSTSYMNLSTAKIRDLGWTPHYSLMDIITNIKTYLAETNCGNKKIEKKL